MAVIQFKSVGKTAADTAAQRSVSSGSLTPIGLKTPLQLGASGEGVFAMHFSLADQLHDNLRNLILTNWGERVIQYDFGANLRELVSEYTNQDNFDAESVQRIARAVQKWMPYVVLNTFESKAQPAANNGLATVDIRVTYDIPLLNVSGRSLVVTIYAMG